MEIPSKRCLAAKSEDGIERGDRTPCSEKIFPAITPAKPFSKFALVSNLRNTQLMSERKTDHAKMEDADLLSTCHSCLQIKAYQSAICI